MLLGAMWSKNSLAHQPGQLWGRTAPPLPELILKRYLNYVAISQKYMGDIMGIFASEQDENDAYRTKEGMVGRSIRRGTDKALKALTFGLLSGSDPVSHLAKDAAKEAPKAYRRSQENK